MANKYPTEHGDVYLLDDRSELGYNLDGTQYSLHATPAYLAGQPITRGFAVSIANSNYITTNSLPGAPGQVYNSLEGILEKTAGIALNTVLGPSVFSGSIPGITVVTTYAGAVTTYTLTGNTSASGVYTINGNTYTYTYSSAITATALVALIITASGGWTSPNYSYAGVSNALNVTSNSIQLEVLDHGTYVWTPTLVATTLTGISIITTVVGNVTTYSLSGTVSNSVNGIITLNGISQTFANGVTASTIASTLAGFSAGGGYVYASAGVSKFSVTTTIFQTSDIGNTAYVLPVSGPLTSPAQQFTTSRNLASALGNPLIEVGIVLSLNSLWIDFEGDSRGAQNLSNVSVIAGEAMYVPTLNLPVDGNYIPIAQTGTGTAFTVPFLVSMNISTGQVFIADRRKTQGLGSLNRNMPLGFVYAANTWPATLATIPQGTSLVVQKAGVLPGFTGLIPGLPVYLDINGKYTQNSATFSYYTDVMTPVGYAFTSTSIYVEIGFNTQTSDSNPIGSIIAQRNATPDAGYLSATIPATVMNIPTASNGTTTIATGVNAGTWDGTGLYGFIGLTFGGLVRYTISGTVTSGQTFYINGIPYTVSGSTAAALATQIAGLSQSGYAFASPISGDFTISNVVGGVVSSPPVITFGSPWTPVFTLATGGTFNLPASNIGTYIYTVTSSGAAGTSPTVLVNGVSVTIPFTNPTVTQITTTLAAVVQTGYVFTLINATLGLFSIQNTTLAYATPSVVPGGTGPAIVNTTFPLTGGTPLFQIKYANFYQANPPQAPLFRYDSNWVNWGTLPSGYGPGSNITLGSNGSFIEFPTATFGSDPPATDLFVELYVTKNGLVRKISPLPLVVSSNVYGYQLSKDIANYVKVEFATQGLAYYDTTGGTGYVAIDSTWQYRFYIYRTQQYNKFLDFTQDQWFSQLKKLTLFDYYNDVTVQQTAIGGYFDRSTTAPINTKRLNYDGNLYSSNGVVSDSFTVNGTSGGISTFNSNVRVNNSSLLIYNGVTQKFSIDLNGNTVIAAGTLSATDSTGVVFFGTSVTGLVLKNTGTNKFSVDASGNLLNAGTLGTTGNATFSANMNINGSTLDSSTATFGMFATPTTLNVGTAGAGTLMLNHLTTTLMGNTTTVKGLLQVGANNVAQTQSSEIDLWKKGTTLVGSSLVLVEASNSLVLSVTNGSSLVSTATFTAGVVTSPSFVGPLTGNVAGNASSATQLYVNGDYAGDASVRRIPWMDVQVGTAANRNMYTTSGFGYSPSTGQLTIGGNVFYIV